MSLPDPSDLSFRRFRRLRRTEGLRRLVRETRLSADDFIYPLFITYGRGVRRPVPSMSTPTSLDDTANTIRSPECETLNATGRAGLMSPAARRGFPVPV